MQYVHRRYRVTKYMLALSLHQFLVEIILFFGGPFTAFILGAGYLFYNKPKFFNATLVFVLSATIVAYLKSIWQLPLESALLLPGWSFPSGHTFFLTSLWLWLAYEFKNYLLVLFVIIFIPLQGYAMIEHNYHNWHDVIAGIYFAICCFPLYIVTMSFHKCNPGYIVIIMIAAIIYLIPDTSYVPSVWGNLGGAIGVVFANHCNQKYIISTTHSTITNQTRRARHMLPEQIFKILVLMIGLVMIPNIMIISNPYITYCQPWLGNSIKAIYIIEFIRNIFVTIWICFLTEYIVYKYAMYKKKIKHI